MHIRYLLRMKIHYPVFLFLDFSQMHENGLTVVVMVVTLISHDVVSVYKKQKRSTRTLVSNTPNFCVPS